MRKETGYEKKKLVNKKSFVNERKRRLNIPNHWLIRLKITELPWK